VGPLLGSNFGTGGSHDLGAILPGDSVAITITNTSADVANQHQLTGLTLLSYTLSNPAQFDLTGFTSGMELAAGGGSVPLSLHAKASLPPGAFSVMLTLNTDQEADYRAAGRQFGYTFTGFNAVAVPEPESAALLLAGLGALALWRRRQGGAGAGARGA